MTATLGRPMKFSTSDELWAKFLEWRDEFKPGGSLQEEIPDVEGFCHFVDSWRDLLNEYETKEDFSVTVKAIKNWIYYRKKQLAMTNKMPAAVFIFDAKNNAGYTDRTEQDITTGGEKISANPDPAAVAKFAEFMNKSDQ